MKYLIIGVFITSTCIAQNNFNQTFSSEGIQHVVIDNFEGDITVVPTSTDEITIIGKHVNKVLSNDLKLKVHEGDGLIAVYLDNPCKTSLEAFDPEKPFDFIRTEQDCHVKENEWNFLDYKFTLEVPRHLNVYVSTIMNGTIDINGIEGIIYASNVNGSIKMDKVTNVASSITVNGNIDIAYRGKPRINSTFKTINGVINLHVPSNSSLKTHFKSYMGKFYTDLEEVEILNQSVEKGILEAGETMNLDGVSLAKIGSGEIDMMIETFNGNAYLKKI